MISREGWRRKKITAIVAIAIAAGNVAVALLLFFAGSSVSYIISGRLTAAQQKKNFTKYFKCVSGRGGDKNLIL